MQINRTKLIYVHWQKSNKISAKTAIINTMIKRTVLWCRDIEMITWFFPSWLGDWLIWRPGISCWSGGYGGRILSSSLYQVIHITTKWHNLISCNWTNINQLCAVFRGNKSSLVARWQQLTNKCSYCTDYSSENFVHIHCQQLYLLHK